MVDELQPRRRQVQRRLHALQRRVRGHLVWEGLAWTFGTIVACAAVSLAVDWLFRLSLPTRLVLLLPACAAIAWVADRKLVRPLSHRLDDLDLAVMIDRKHPGVSQRAAVVLQLPSLLEGKIQASPALVRAAVLEHAEALEAVDFSAALNRRRARKCRFWLLGSLAVVCAFTLLWPQTAGLWAKRWLMGSNERWPQQTYLSLVGLGDSNRVLVPRGETHILIVEGQPTLSRRDNGWFLTGRGEPLVLHVDDRPATRVPEQVRVRYRGAESGTRRGSFSRVAETRFRYELPPVSETLEASITGGDDWFGPITIEPIDRPTIESLVLTARPPGSSREEEHQYEGAETPLLFLLDTELTLRFNSDVPLESVTLQSKTGAAPEIELVDQRTCRAKWTFTEATTLQIELVSREGRLKSKPYFLSIGLLKDRKPRVSIRSSGVGRRVTPQVRIPLNSRALDDFGLVGFGLEIEQRLPTDEPGTRTLDALAFERPPEEDETTPLLEWSEATTLQLAPRNLPPGAVVRIRGQATDGCAQGSQTGESRWLAFQFVPPEQLFYEILMRQRAERAKFRAAHESAEEQKGELDTLVEIENAAALVRRHQVIARQTWQIGNRLAATLEEMKLNELGSPQAWELLETNVINALRELHEDELSRMRTLLDRLAADPDSMDATLAEARPLQGEIVEEMRKILAQMAQWESFVDVLNQLRQVIQLQDNVLKETEKTRKERIEEVFEE